MRKELLGPSERWDTIVWSLSQSNFTVCTDYIHLLPSLQVAEA
jgi:hypothetical protein